MRYVLPDRTLKESGWQVATIVVERDDVRATQCRNANHSRNGRDHSTRWGWITLEGLPHGRHTGSFVQNTSVSTRAESASGYRTFATVLAAVLLVATIILISTTPALATAKNQNLDGKWRVGGAENGTIAISGENVTTGTFGGVVQADGVASSLEIVDGQVTGDSFTFTGQYAGTVVDEHGTQFYYAGTVSGNVMIIRLTGLQGWDDGKPVDETDNDRGPFKAVRAGVDLSGTIVFGCSGGASCSTGSAPLYDATVAVDGPTSASTKTDTDGKWTLPVAPGHYTITPSAPDVTFTPDSIDVDVTKATVGQDFTSCAADSSAASSSLRAPLLRDNASSLTWSLTGDYCNNFYSVIYSKPTGSATVKWIAKKYICDVDGNKFFNANLSRTIFDNAFVGSSAAPGNITTLANKSVQINVDNAAGTNVLACNIAAGGATGTVTTDAAVYTVSVGLHVCLPVEAKHSKLPFTAKAASGT